MKIDNNNDIDIKKRNISRIIKYTLVTILASVVSSFALHVFVYPANFVPLGLEAVVTMLQSIFKINAGYFNLALNLPLYVYALIKLDKKYTVFALLFTLLSSMCLILFETLGVPQYVPSEKILSAIFAGILLGVRTGLMLKIGSSSGGIDIVAAALQKKAVFINIERIITVLCLILIGVSYFVYKDFDCILLGIVQMFISEKATTLLLKSNRKAIKVEIITKEPYRIKEDLVKNFRHTGTVTECTGMFSKERYYNVTTVLNLYQMEYFADIMKKYSDSFIYYSEVDGVMGNFRRNRDEAVK